MIRKLAVLMLLLAGIGLVYAGPNRERRAGAEEINDLSQLSKNNRGYAEINPGQLRSLLEGKDFLLVNVNSAAAEIIPQTDFTVPFDQLEENLTRFPRKDQPTVLYCQAGGLSRSSARDLVELGFTNVVWLDGGISAWKKAGYKVEAK